ncbi:MULTISPECIES: aldehyde dehydrogenase family protein [unclassified Microbacterium]|uniref:aldehyde dehydrogenase family protein n=1 Tax=unclassified Microbacterium TaxID=2609290 RepID=UPI001E57E79B|nr:MULTISPECIES: aldehyde dehydrogenase family protein [unclassified Microbacterium]
MSSTSSDPIGVALDRDVAALRAGLPSWTHLTLEQRARLFERVRASVVSCAQDWAEQAALIKGLDSRHPLRGEEWLSGPYAVIVALDAYIRTLTALSEGHSPIDGLKLGTAPGGRVTVPAFPATRADALLLSGFTADVWLRPGVTAVDARSAAGLGQKHPAVGAGVGLVLGAGNVTAIPVLDVLYELIAANRVAILKLNPTMDALAPVFRRALAPLIAASFVRIVTGDGAVGAALTTHPGIDHVHITGSAVTFDAIVWGTDEEAARRRQDHDPALAKPITAELGGVSPVIVVPGEWTAADLRFQAEHVATMRLQNAGHNCIAGQMVVISRDWAQRGAFLSELRAAYLRAPHRPTWYPHAPERVAEVAASTPVAETYDGGGERVLMVLDADQDASALETTEYFAPILGVVDLPGTGQRFLDAAVTYANDRLTGTLGANLLIDPATRASLGAGFDRAIAELRYGAIAINAWTGFNFLLANGTWGAFPGGTLEDVGSGIGIVHNALLLEGVERTVVHGPFRPFPRSLGDVRDPAERTVLPKPPWFVTARTGAEVSEGFTRYQMTHNAAGLARTLALALRA